MFGTNKWGIVKNWKTAGKSSDYESCHTTTEREEQVEYGDCQITVSQVNGELPRKGCPLEGSQVL